MKLKKKFFITFAVAIIAYIGASYFLQHYYIVPSYEAMDKTIALQDIRRCELGLKFISVDLERIVRDYAIWDDIYEYMGGKNASFTKTNLDSSTFENNNVDFIMLYDTDKKLVWGDRINPLHDKNLHPDLDDLNNALAKEYPNILSSKNTSGIKCYSGLVRVKGFIVIVGSCSIYPADKNGECRGTFVMATIVDTKKLESLSKMLLIDFTMAPLTGKERSYASSLDLSNGIYYIEPVSNQFFEAFSGYSDINGNLEFKLKTIVSRGIFLKSWGMANLSFYLGLIGGVILLILIGITIEMMIIGPISKIVAHAKRIKEKNDYMSVLEIKNKDEIGELGQEFTLMLRQIKGHSDGLENLVKEKTEEVRLSRNEMVYRLASAAENRDTDTGMHLKRMYEYSKLLAKNCNLSEGYCEIISLGGILHDVGKIGIPDSILLKPAKLTPEEYEIIKKHTTIGAKILENGNSKLMLTAYEIALYHHERYDGTGYPEGRKGEKIPLSARITAIVDVFDALSSKRPYKEPWDIKQIIRYFNEEKGKMFDPQIVNCFLLDIDSFLKIKTDNADK
ncbi:MAG: HD domain-containing phosphohydrolase [Lentisphaerota bacterium]